MSKVLAGTVPAFQHEGTTTKRLLVEARWRNWRRVKDDILDDTPPFEDFLQAIPAPSGFDVGNRESIVK
jgi:hypothetical protein